jgi:iron-sulfur cluster repair protein YtfE (RIC family)
VKRHPALVPLSHDHHHALVQARRLGKAADGDHEGRRAATGEFLGFFSTETLTHFREEEELLFPLLVDQEGEARSLLVQALLEHQRVHALVARLQEEPDASTMRELADLLQAHVRLEERQLFPLIEAVVPERLSEGTFGAER